MKAVYVLDLHRRAPRERQKSPLIALIRRELGFWRLRRAASRARLHRVPQLPQFLYDGRRRRSA